MNQHEKPTAYEDEINLYDYWKVIAKRKKLIIGLFIISIISAAAVSFLMPKIYEVKTVLEIGKTSAHLETPNELKAKIDTAYFFNTRAILNIREREAPKIKTEILRDTHLIRTSIESSKPELAVKILDDINRQILEQHGYLISNFRIDVANRIKSLDRQIEVFKKDKKTVLSNIEIIKKDKAKLLKRVQDMEADVLDLTEEKRRLDLQANPDNVLAILLFNNEMQAIHRHLDNLQNRLNVSLPREELEFKLRLENIEKSIKGAEDNKRLLQNQLDTVQETKILKLPASSEYPVKPKTKMNIALAGIVSLFAGIFIAFFAEYINKIKNRQNS